MDSGGVKTQSKTATVSALDLVLVFFAYLQISSDGFLSFRLGAGQLLPQHLLPHVDGLQRLLDVEEVLLKMSEREKHVYVTFLGRCYEVFMEFLPSLRVVLHQQPLFK